MLLDASGLKIASFDSVLAAVLGNAAREEGCNVVAEAMIHRHNKVHLRDWLYCLLKSPGTEIRRQLIDQPGRNPDRVVNALEAAHDEDLPPALMPARLTAAMIDKPVAEMLAAAEDMAMHKGGRPVDDSMLALALLRSADETIRRSLNQLHTEEGMKRLVRHFEQRVDPGASTEISLFDSSGALSLALFAPSGLRFCHRLAEDAAACAAKKITVRHLLYTLLGNDGGILSTALSVRGTDVKRELHAVLSRELVRPGSRRTDTFTLSRETLFEAVQAVFKAAAQGARDRGSARIAEYDVARSFVSLQKGELARLFPSSRPLDLAALASYIDSSDPEAEQETITRRFSIADVEARIKARICGQDHAVARVIPWIKRLRFGLPRDGRPAAVLLFLGPTGTGKTQMARELARYVFGDEEMMLFLEMGQFKTKESMSGFVGAPPGYVGYGEGKLTNGLRDKPQCVVLFDEIEKADSQVLDTLLRFADEGLISDPAGPVRDGRQCIIVMTTNAGQEWLRDPHREKYDNLEQLAEKLLDVAVTELHKIGFRQEFLGRVDERICFFPLTEETLLKIAESALKRDAEQLKQLKGVEMEIGDKVTEILAAKAFARSEKEGARGVPRAINEFIISDAIDEITTALENGEAIHGRKIKVTAELNDEILVRWADASPL